MSAISEDEADRYHDLYCFETNCIDFLRSMKRLREGAQNYTPEDAIVPAKEMQAFLGTTLIALENLSNYSPIKRHHWYRVDSQVIYCLGYTETYSQKGIHVDMEGVSPRDYAAYATRYRTDIPTMPTPDLVNIQFIPITDFEEISADEALTQKETEE